MKKPNDNERVKCLNTNLNMNQKYQEISLKTEINVANKNTESSEEVVWKKGHHLENEHNMKIPETQEIVQNIIKEKERTNNNELNHRLCNYEQVEGFKGGTSNESNDERISDQEKNIETENIVNEEQNIKKIKIDNCVDGSYSALSKSESSSANGTDQLSTELMNFGHTVSTNRINDPTTKLKSIANKENTMHNNTITKSIYENYNNTEVNSTPDILDLLNPAAFDKQESTTHTEGNSYNNDICIIEKNQRDLRNVDYMLDKCKYIIETKKEIVHCNDERNNNNNNNNNTNTNKCETNSNAHINGMQPQVPFVVDTHKENFKEKEYTEINGNTNLHEQNCTKEREPPIYPNNIGKILMKENTECTNQECEKNTIQGDNSNMHISTVNKFPCSDATEKMLKNNMYYSLNKKRNHCEIQLSHKQIGEEIYKKIKYPVLQIIKNEHSKVFNNFTNSFQGNEDFFGQKDSLPMGENEEHVQTQINNTNSYIPNDNNNNNNMNNNINNNVNNSNNKNGICKTNSKNNVEGKLNCCNHLVGYCGKEGPPPCEILERFTESNKEEKDLNIEKCNLINRQIQQFLKIVEKISSKVKDTELGKLLCKKFLTPCEREKRKNIMSHFLDIKKCCEFFLVNIRDDALKDSPWKKDYCTEKENGEKILKKKHELIMQRQSENSEENTNEEEYETNEEAMNGLKNGNEEATFKKTSNYTYVPNSINQNKMLTDFVKKPNSLNTMFVAKSAQTVSIKRARANYLNNVKMGYGNNVKEMRNYEIGNSNKEDTRKPMEKETTFFEYTQKNNIQDKQIIKPNEKENDFFVPDEFFNDAFFKCNNE